MRNLFVFLTLLAIAVWGKGVLIAPSGAQPSSADNCIACHTDAGKLMSLVRTKEKPPEGGCGAAPARPLFLNYFVHPDFLKSLHGSRPCTDCHGGNPQATEVETAHQNMKKALETCTTCHRQTVERQKTSIHMTLAGQDVWLKRRAGQENFDKLLVMRQNDCNKCHAGCADCHITIPQAVGGGLINGHRFFKRPPMEETCTVCHGTRAGAEYLGTVKEEEIPADVHFQKGMHCVDCHKEPMHGDGKHYESRWEVAGLPKCTDCHQALPNTSTPAHTIPKHQQVSCQVCHAATLFVRDQAGRVTHAQSYNNCFNCHSGFDEKNTYYRIPERKLVLFKIGKNTVPSYPYETVPVRHNPIARNTFDYFGKNLLPHFDDYPNWKTAAPHNMQRVTSQNRQCNACHGNEALFLLEKDLDPNDAQANKKVVFPKVP